MTFGEKSVAAYFDDVMMFQTQSLLGISFLIQITKNVFSAYCCCCKDSFAEIWKQSFYGMTEDNFGDFLRFFLCEFVTVLTKVTARGFLEKFLKLNLHNLYAPKLP